jgi:hypothetical protein
MFKKTIPWQPIHNKHVHVETKQFLNTEKQNYTLRLTLSIFQPLSSSSNLLFEIHPNTALSSSVRSSMSMFSKRPSDRSSVIVTRFSHPRQRNSVWSRDILQRISSPDGETGRLSGAFSTELNAHARTAYSWHRLPIFNPLTPNDLRV